MAEAYLSNNVELFKIVRALPARIAGLVTIAAAPDFTEDGYWASFTEAQKQTLAETGQVELPSDYMEPYIITRRMIDKFGKTAGCPACEGVGPGHNEACRKRIMECVNADDYEKAMLDKAETLRNKRLKEAGLEGRGVRGGLEARRGEERHHREKPASGRASSEPYLTKFTKESLHDC